MKNQTIALVVGLIVAFIFAGFLGTQLGAQPEDLEEYEECIQEQYDMSPTEVFVKTGIKPECNVSTR